MRDRKIDQINFAGHSRKYPTLPLALDGFGIRHQQEPIDRAAGINSWQWIQCVEGSGMLVVDSKAYHVTPGSGMLIPRGAASLYHDNGKSWYVNFLCCGGALIDEITTQLGLYTAGAYQLSNPDIILKYWEEIEELYSRNEMNAHFALSALIYRMLVELSQEILLSHAGGAQPQNEKIHDAIRFIQAHYSEEIGLAEIADAAGLSKEYLCQIFKKHTGSTVLEYLTETRIAEAKVLLLSHPTKTIGEIARLCGFGSSSYFCSVFKRSEQMTPLQFAQGR